MFKLIITSLYLSVADAFVNQFMIDTMVDQLQVPAEAKRQIKDVGARVLRFKEAVEKGNCKVIKKEVSFAMTMAEGGLGQLVQGAAHASDLEPEIKEFIDIGVNKVFPIVRARVNEAVTRDMCPDAIEHAIEHDEF